MNELDIAENALEQIVGYYRRSHKHDKNTCYQMYLEAERALREIRLLTQRTGDMGGRQSQMDSHSRPCA